MFTLSAIRSGRFLAFIAMIALLFSSAPFALAGGAVSNVSVTGFDGQCAIVGDTVTVNATVSATNPPGQLSQYGYVIYWGDGTQTDSGTGFFSDFDPVNISEDHTYNTEVPGGLTITVAVYHQNPNGQDGSDEAEESIELCIIEETGSITIVKDTDDASGDAVAFDFTGDLGAFSVLGDNSDSETFDELDAGTYEITESAEDGWTFDSVTCDASEYTEGNPLSIDLQEGEDVTCTFTNTKDAVPTGSLTILKETDDVSGEQTEFDFELNDAAFPDTILGNNADYETFSDLAVGTHVVTELNETGWDFDSVSCDVDADGGAKWSNTGPELTVDIAEDDDITCTFSNTIQTTPTATGTMTVYKVVDDESGNQVEFDFTIDSSNNDFDGVMGIVGGQNQSRDDILPATYTFTELPEAGWTLDDISCTAQGGSTFDYGTSSVTVTFEEGDDVECTFTNLMDDDGGPSPTQCQIGENLLLNGGFEAPVVTDAADWDVFPSGTGGLEWIVEWASAFIGAPETANLEIHAGVNSWAPAEGYQYAELDSDWGGPGHGGSEEASTRIAQTVSTGVGNTYELSYQFSPRPDTDSAQNSLEVLVDGSVEDTTSGDGSSNSDTDWSSRSFQFVATGTSTEIAFADAGTPDAVGTFLDDVALCLVEEAPEPVTETIQMCKYDEESGQPISGWGMTLSNDTEDGTYNLVTGEDGCVYQEVDPEEGPWHVYEEEVDGWNFIDVEAFGGSVVDIQSISACEFFPELDEQKFLFVQVLVDDVQDNFRCNFYNEQEDGGGGGSSTSGGGGGPKIELRNDPDPEPEDEPEPEVAGAQTEILPAGAPNAGMGGAAAQSSTTLFALFTLIASAFAVRRVN